MPSEPRLFYFVVVTFLIVLAVLWFLLPFAIFGTKPLLEELIKETKITNDLMRQQLGQHPTNPITASYLQEHAPDEHIISGG